MLKKLFYKGAGVLLYRMTEDDECNVLLFKRNNNPDKHRYSITGGKMDAGDRDDYRTTAARETLEEVGIRVDIPKDCPHQSTNLFFFKWKTYFLPYEGVIDERRFRRSEILGYIEVPLKEALRRNDIGCPMPRTLRALRRKLSNQRPIDRFN